LSSRSKPEPVRESNERSTARDRGARGEKQKPLKQRISEAEAEIERITAIIAKIDTALSLPDIFTRDPKQAAQLSQARVNAADALQRAEEDWLSASAQNEETAG
jgi:ATP-binding cassette, subfamily F, member 3